MATLSTPSSPPPQVWVWKTADPTSALFYWGRFFALAAHAVVFCSLHTMPARHGAPRVHSKNASLGAGRACSRLGHCGSLRARGACFASEPGFPKSLHHSVVGRRDGDLGVPIGFQHFPGPCFLGGSRDPGFLINLMRGRLKFCLLGKFWVFYFRSLLQRALLAGSGAQPPRLHFSQFPCNHLILVSPPPPPPPR